MNTLAWVTPRCFVETDIYVISELILRYKIYWFILDTDECYEYDTIINEIDAHPNAFVERRILPARNRRLKCIPFYYNLIRYIKKVNADLLYGAISGMPFYMPMLRILYPRKKCVVAIHNVSIPKGAATEKWDIIYTNFVIRSFNNFHTFSKAQCELLQQKKVNANIFQTSFILKDYGSSTVPKDKVVSFLFFGLIHEYKRLDVLIEAAQQLYEETKLDFKVKIAGKSNNWSRYETLIRYPNLFQTTIRRIENDEIPDLFTSSHYYVLPYQDIAQSGALMVGINYNLPLIASNLPAFNEFNKDGVTGYVIPPASIVDLKEAMRKAILEYDSQYHYFVENINKLKEGKLKASSIAEIYDDYFKKIIE